MRKVKSDNLDIKLIEEKLNSIKNFRELKGYQKALLFYEELYKILRELPYYEQYGIYNQMERCTMSIIANLAEGNGRLYCKEKCNFYSISLATSNETQCWIDIMKIKGYINQEQFTSLNNKVEEIKKLIIVYIKQIASEIE